MKYVVTLAGREIEVEVDGDRVVVDGIEHRASLTAAPGTPLRLLLLEGRSVALGVEPAGRGHWVVARGGERHEAEALDERTRHIRSLVGGEDRARGPAVLRAPMPGLVVRVQVTAGQTIAAGAGVVVLEAMKMENELRASAAVTVRAVRVSAGEAVEKGQVLVEYQ